MLVGRIHPRLVSMIAGIAALAALIGLGQPEEKERSAGTGVGTGPAVRLAYFPNLTHAPALIGVSSGRFERALAPARLEPKVVNAGPEAMEALLAGELDLAYVGPSPALNTFLKSGGKAIRVVAGAASGGASLVAASGSGIRSLRDLVGRRVATPQLGNTQDVSLRRFLLEAGIEPADVQILPIKNPDILTQFKLGELDAAWVPEPWATRLVQEVGARRVLDERELWPEGRFATAVLVASAKFAEQHPEAVERLVQANSDVIAEMTREPAAAKLVANRELKRLTGAALPEAVLSEAWSRIDFSADPLPDSFEAFREGAVRCGYLKDEGVELAAMFLQVQR